MGYSDKDMSILSGTVGSAASDARDGLTLLQYLERRIERIEFELRLPELHPPDVDLADYPEGNGLIYLRRRADGLVHVWQEVYPRISGYAHVRNPGHGAALLSYRNWDRMLHRDGEEALRDG